MGETGMTNSTGEPLRQKLDATRRRWRLADTGSGLAWTLCLLVFLALLCYHADRAWHLSASARELWRLGIGGVGLVALLVALIRPALRRLPDSVLAADVERHYPALRERLLTVISLGPALATPEGSPAFSSAMATQLLEETQRESAALDFRRAVNMRPLRIAGLTTAFALLLLVLHAVFAPEAFAVWLQRMARPHADIAPYAQTRVWLTPDAELIPSGEGVSVRVTTRGTAPDRATLRYHLDGEPVSAWKTVTLTNPTPKTDETASRKESIREFHYRFPALTQSVALVAAANDGTSNERRVSVEARPIPLNFHMTLHFPAYMKRSPQVMPETTGNITAPVGTEVAIQTTANKPLRSIEVTGSAARSDDWKVEGEKANGKLTVRKDGIYSLRLTDTHGFASPNPPVRYEVHAIRDQSPSVQIQRPGTDIDLVPDGSLPLVAHASDDYGVSRMRLIYDTTTNEKPGDLKAGQAALDLPGPDGSPQANVSERWHIGGARAKPGEILRYAVEATDNDTLDGPHTTRSLGYRIHVVSLPEMQRRLKEQLDEESRALAQIRQRQIEAQKQLQDARRKPDAAALSKAQEQQRAVSQQTRALAQRANDLSAQLENNNLATKSELQRRDAAQQTLQNLAQQKMPQAADTIQKAQTPQPNDPSRAQSLAQADQQQSQIKSEIEKAQQMLSRAPSTQQIAEEAARLAQEQQRLADSARALDEDQRAQKQATGSSKLTPDQKAGLEMERRQQAQANADTQRLERQLEQAARSAEERGDNKEAQALRRAAEQLKQGNVAGNQSKAQQSLQRNQPAQAAPNQDKAATALQKAAESAQEAASENSPDSAEKAAERLEQSAERLRAMAEQQRQIADQIAQKPNAADSRALAQKENALRQQAAQEQQALRNAGKAQQSLQSAQQSLGQSSQQLSQNNSQSAQSPSQNAAQQLERAAQQAQNAAQQMRQQQAANEMQEAIERMAQIQRGLQDATKRLDTRRKSGALNGIEQRELAQVGARQETLERESQRLAQKFPSPSFQQALNMAARQMRPASARLNREQPDTGTTTQAAQNRAAQTLETIAQALKQQSQGNGQQQDGQQGGQQQGGGSAQEAQQAAALGDLLLSQGLQKQVRQETGSLDKARQRNHNQELSPEQRAEAGQLTQNQQDAQSIADRAADQLDSLPDVARQVRDATQQMQQSAQKLRRQQTGHPTQQNQDDALSRLDAAAKQAQQAMQQQQQQQQARQMGQQGAPQPVKGKGNTPNPRPFTRLEDTRKGAMSTPESRNGRGFASLSQRAQRTLREGQQERVPAEYQDIVSRYYKSLAEKKR